MRPGVWRARRRLGILVPLLAMGAAACGGGRPPGAAPPPDSFQLGSGARPPAMVATPRLARPPTPPPAFDDPQRAARLRRALPAVEKMVAAHVAAGAIPALAVGVVLDGELVLAKGWGHTRSNGQPVDGDTVFRLGSVTKVVTGMAVLDLVADGKLGLDDPAAQHLPELAGLLYPTLDGGVITIRHLLTHTSGLPRDRQLPGLEQHPSEADVLAALDGLTLERAPGEAVAYSNLGGGLLGMIVARASGMAFRDYVARRVLEPLGIDGMKWDAGDVPLDRLAAAVEPGGRTLSTAEHERIGPLEGSGGLYGSVGDLAKLAAAHLDAWPPRSDPERGPVPRALLRASHRMQAFRGLRADGSDDVRATADGTGLVWQIRQTCDLDHLVWHNGSIEGYRSALFLLPERGLAVIVLATGSDDDPSPLASRMLTSLIRDAELGVRRSQPSPALATAIDEVARMYELGNVNEPSYQSLFAASFRERISLQDVRRVLTTSKSKRGPCRLDGVVSAAGPYDAHVRLRCERGEALLHLRLAPQKPHPIRYLLDDPAAAAEGPRGPERCRASTNRPAGQ